MTVMLKSPINSAINLDIFIPLFFTRHPGSGAKASQFHTYILSHNWILSFNTFGIAVNAIGVISGLLTIFSFGEDHFGKEVHSGSTIKVAVALDGPQISNAGGDLPDVRIWNEIGTFVGITVDPGKVKNGNVGEIHVEHQSQGVYSLFSANDDAICVAWVTTTFTDDRGGNKYAVSGDIGQACGAPWYPSNLHSDIKVKDTGEFHQPTCFWIDKNGDQPMTGFQVYWPAFAERKYSVDDTDAAKLCNGIDFGLRNEKDPRTITYRTKTKRSMPIRSRGFGPSRPEWAKSELVISDSEFHSAEKLCISDTSMGPDFVHTGEGLFCDMDAKTLYPLCTGIEEKGADCFDLNAQRVNFGSKTDNIKTASSVSPAGEPNRYPRVRIWTSNGTVV
ncbi:hypothetical protein TESG_00584 [Trichophyton tonsurans CBS 112818]|uniref:Uncharacterized protein n=1 Tax=Trichophyton tonsurans (strain CBS 112818) TaxID=647933 RepID=F2RNX1_TRIT1|nr:hypothetical protein TESG_00584 [Trichophyton tonsurans CBS 112818]